MASMSYTTGAGAMLPLGSVSFSPISVGSPRFNVPARYHCQGRLPGGAAHHVPGGGGVTGMMTTGVPRVTVPLNSIFFSPPLLIQPGLTVLAYGAATVKLAGPANDPDALPKPTELPLNLALRP